jgi:hypothetical protein
MFEWLAQEIDKIKTRRFHVVGGPADDALKAAIEGFEAPLPRSYKEFARRFGNARLFRRDLACRLGVWVPPMKEQSWNGEDLYGIGHYQSESAYLKASLLRGDYESPVFEGDSGRQVKVANGFEEWLIKRYQAVRRTYGKKKWAEIVAGPAPFTPEEQRIVDARRRFTWRVLSITPACDFLLEVHNGSDLILPFLSIGVQLKAGTLVDGMRLKADTMVGGIWLPVSHIHPGQMGKVECDAYKKLYDPSDIEFVPNPDPSPEDREYYWEFKAIPPQNELWVPKTPSV